MAKLSEKYEAVVVFSLKNGEDAVKALVAKFSDLIKEHGTLVDVDEWGARSSLTRLTTNPTVIM